MDQPALRELLRQLLAEWESEVVEFKRAGNDYDTDRIGKYFSALANEANLRGRDSAWLVFGVDNNSRKICGTAYRLDRERLEGLKHQINQGADPSTTLRNIHELGQLWTCNP